MQIKSTKDQKSFIINYRLLLCLIPISLVLDMTFIIIMNELILLPYVIIIIQKQPSFLAYCTVDDIIGCCIIILNIYNNGNINCIDDTDDLMVPAVTSH